MSGVRLLLISGCFFVLALVVPAQPRLIGRPVMPLAAPTPPVETTARTTPSTDDEVIRIETDLVSLPVRAVDRNGRFIAGLRPEEFEVFENDVRQDIALFANEQQAFTVVLVLDMSYSAKFRADEIQNAALEFIKQLRPKDRVMVISFDQEVHVHCEPTNDRELLRRAILETEISYGTSLYDAMELFVAQRLRQIDGRKAVVLFSDGVDTSSTRADAASNLQLATELDALVYPIEYDTFREVQATRTANSGSDKGTTVAEYKIAADYLREMAARTGGRVYRAGTLLSLKSSFSRIAAELREYYSLGYYPTESLPADGHRRIKIRVKRPGVIVRTRENALPVSR